MGLEERIGKGELDPICLLVSDEPLLVERAVAAIRAVAVPESLRGFNEDVFDGKGLTAARVRNAAQTLPMMAPRRLVIVRDLAAMVAAELAGLLPYLERPSPSTVLVGVATKIDKRLKFWAAAGKAGVLHELSAPRDLGAFVRGEASRQGVALEPAAGSRLAEVVGKDLSRLSLSLGQLALYAAGRAVTVDDVDDLVAETRERSIFELSDAAFAGDGPRARVALDSLIDQRQSAVGVIAMLARQVRQIGMCVAAEREGVPRGELGKLVGVPPFIVDKLVAQARRFGPAAVTRATGELAWADRALKGEAQMARTLGRALTERTVLEKVVGTLVGLARA